MTTLYGDGIPHGGALTRNDCPAGNPRGKASLRGGFCERAGIDLTQRGLLIGHSQSGSGFGWHTAGQGALREILTDWLT